MIGIFDSGVGGLTLVKKLLKLEPLIDFIYLGDTARIPYGMRSQKTVQRYSAECTDFLIEKGCDIIVVACNSATSLALPYLQEKYKDKHIIGVVIPGVEAALACTRNKKIGVVGTTGTINSGAYERELLKLNPDIQVYSQSCPLLVPLTEEGWGDHHITRTVVRTYMRKLKDVDIDTLILGCTHYPVIKKVFQQIMGRKVTIVNPGKEAAKNLIEYCERHAIPVSKTGLQQYFVTDQSERFLKIGQRFLKTKILKLELIQLKEME